MIALLDGDIVAYRCAASAKADDPEWVATSRANTLVEQILEETKADEFRIFLSGPKNFRKLIYPEYKANRVQPPPPYLAACKSYLVDKWGAVWTDGYEADDALGIHQTKGLYEFDPDSRYWNQPEFNRNTVICSIDKDLKQVPGHHYNFVKKETTFVDTLEGWRNFYIQLLVGDASDNIKGCPGIGKVKAPRLLEGCKTDQDMFDTVRGVYNDDDSMFLNAQLLYILREENKHWKPESYTTLDQDQ